jgi:hypothetical protein
MATVANLALEGGDPRDVAHPAIHGHEPAETQLLRGIHDSSVTFEEYSEFTTSTLFRKATRRLIHSPLAAIWTNLSQCTGPPSHELMRRNRMLYILNLRVQEP